VEIIYNISTVLTNIILICVLYLLNNEFQKKLYEITDFSFFQTDINLFFMAREAFVR